MRSLKFYSYTFGLLLLAAQILQAQPTLTSNISPELGTSIQVSIVDPEPLGILVLPAGEGIIWDFSASPVTETRVGTFVDASETEQGIFFPNADIALSYDGEGLPLGSFNLQNDFFALFADSVLNVGFATENGTVINYQNPLTLFNLPFTYGDSLTDDFSVSFEVGASTVVEAGTLTVEADAYGTVLLPNDEMTDLLRVRTTRNYFQAFPPELQIDTIFFEEERFEWFAADQIYPVLSVTTEMVSTNPSAQTRIYFTGDVETNIEEYIPTASIEAYPNPSNGIFQLQYDLVQTADVQVNIYNSMGQLIQIGGNSRQNAGSQTTQIDLTGQASGMYFAEMILNERERIVHKLMVQ